MIIIYIFLIVLLLFILQEKIYSKNCYKNFSVELTFDKQGIFQEEKVRLTAVLFNKKLLPIWWVGIKYKLSPSLLTEEMKKSKEVLSENRKDIFFISSYEKITKTITLEALKRGYYKIDRIDLETGDLFGGIRILKTLPCSSELYVYPKLIDVKEMDVFFKRMNGEVISKRHIIEDPFQLRGIREYSPSDSMRYVNWKATARSLDLKVNQFDYTASGQVTLLLNLERFNSWDSDDILEASISLVASLTTEYIKQGMNVELITNGCDIVTGKAVEVTFGNNLNHSLSIYENLARIDIKKTNKPFTDILIDEIDSIRKNNIIVFVSQYYDKFIEDIIVEKRAAKYDIKWIIPNELNKKVELENLNNIYVWEVNNI